MHTLLAHPCLAAVGEYIPFAGMLIPITVMFIVMLIAVAGMYFKNQSHRMWHETARAALEKGQPIPVAPTAQELASVKKPELPSGRGDVKAGLILIAIAVGMYFGFNEPRDEWHHVPSFLYYVPGFIGLALLLNALITFLTTRKNSEETKSPLPPKA